MKHLLQLWLVILSKKEMMKATNIQKFMFFSLFSLISPLFALYIQ